MTVMSYLILSVGLFLVTIVVQALCGIKQYGLVPLAGARDGLAAPNLFLDRAKRTTANMAESMVMFVPLVLIAVHTGNVEGAALTGAMLFFWGRLAYAPLYWFGVPWLRTVAWAVAFFGIMMIFRSLLPLV